ncbi:MAG: beta-N-acetylhexosaminidase [Lachnospiraceae bacterium]|nr:beta-N-acetylhexosaminidase [Lachnospiraceae bacterium]
MDRKKRHSRVVRQRILAFVFTILVLALITFGMYMGIRYLADMGLFDKKPEPVTEVATEPTEEPSEESSWVSVETEEIKDDYAEVDTTVLSEDEIPSEEAVIESDEEIESIVSNLDLEEKVSQLFLVTPESITGMETVTRAGDTTRDALTQYPVGGLIYFEQNFEDPDQTKEMLANTSAYITDACGIKPFLAVDEEGGRVVRLAEHEGFEIENVGPMADIGSSGDIDKAYEAGATIAAYMTELGLNLDFAPVADVLTDSSSEVIGDRSFGSDAGTVARLSWQVASGLQDNGVVACFKHFPGHGSVGGDTHTSSVSSPKTKEELYKSDLIPFQNAIDSGARMIMISHISYPEITGDDMPASLSGVMINDILRGELGYTGVIITDSFLMDAVTQKYQDPGEAAVAALNAGADMILMPADFHEAYNAVLSAASSGSLDEAKIDDSLRRILKVKLGR